MEGTLCPKCSKPLEKDARVCLSCGYRIQGGGKEVKFSPPDSKSISKNPSSSSHSSFLKKRNSSDQKKNKQSSLIFRFFSFCFLLFTLGFAYAYLFDIQKILILPNTLVQYGQLKISSGVLFLMKQGVLSKDKALVTFNSAQVKLLNQNQNSSSSGGEMTFKDFKGKWTREGFLLDFTLENLSPFATSVSPSYFFIRILPDHYLMAKPAEDRNRVKRTLQSWKSTQMSVLFSSIPFFDTSLEIKATLIFNDGKTYFSRDIILPKKVS